MDFSLRMKHILLYRSMWNESLPNCTKILTGIKFRMPKIVKNYQTLYVLEIIFRDDSEYLIEKVLKWIVHELWKTVGGKISQSHTFFNRLAFEMILAFGLKQTCLFQEKATDLLQVCFCFWFATSCLKHGLNTVWILSGIIEFLDFFDFRCLVANL